MRYHIRITPTVIGWHEDGSDWIAYSVTVSRYDPDPFEVRQWATVGTAVNLYTREEAAAFARRTVERDVKLQDETVNLTVEVQ
jgi:hypothetical protein